MILSDAIAPKIGSAEGEALCWGSGQRANKGLLPMLEGVQRAKPFAGVWGVSEKFLFPFCRRRRQVNENEKGLHFLLKKGQTSYDHLRKMRE